MLGAQLESRRRQILPCQLQPLPGVAPSPALALSAKVLIFKLLTWIASAGLPIADQTLDIRRPPVPQVASEATSAFRPAPPTLMRPAPSAEGAPDLPFESLLDTDTQAAPPPPQAPQASQPPQSRPATPDGAPQKATGSSAAETDGKASGNRLTAGRPRFPCSC